jgi:hypothetical protein
MTVRKTGKTGRKPAQPFTDEKVKAESERSAVGNSKIAREEAEAADRRDTMDRVHSLSR